MMKDKPANYIWPVTLIIRCTPYWILLWLCLLQYYYLYEKSSQFNQEAILTAYFYSNNWCLDIKYIDSSCFKRGKLHIQNQYRSMRMLPRFSQCVWWATSENYRANRRQ